MTQKMTKTYYKTQNRDKIIKINNKMDNAVSDLIHQGLHMSIIDCMELK